MKFFSTVALLVSPFAISATRITWDSVYDQGTESLNAVACSNGANGMVTKGYNFFKDLPTFPNIGGSSVITGWNSIYCGTCWNVTYEDVSIVVTVIDYAGDGYNLSEEAMNNLTDGRAVELGVVYGTSVQVPNSVCGLA